MLTPTQRYNLNMDLIWAYINGDWLVFNTLREKLHRDIAEQDKQESVKRELTGRCNTAKRKAP